MMTMAHEGHHGGFLATSSHCPIAVPIKPPRHQYAGSPRHSTLPFGLRNQALVAIHSLPINGRETCALPPSPIEHGRLSQITHTSISQDVPCLCGGLLLRDSLTPMVEIWVKSRFWVCRTAQAMFLSSFHRQSSNHERPANDRVRLHAQRPKDLRTTHCEFHRARARAKNLRSLERLEPLEGS